MKYSYMVTTNPNRVKFGDYWMDSDERTIDFRNQYGEIFVLASRKAVYMAMMTCIVIGMIIGHVFL